MYPSNTVGRSPQMHGHGVPPSPHMGGYMQGMGVGGPMPTMGSMQGMPSSAPYPVLPMHGHSPSLPNMGGMPHDSMQGSEHWSGGSDSLHYHPMAGRDTMYSGNQGMQSMSTSYETHDQLVSQPMDLDSSSDPDMYETSVYLGVNNMPDDFDVRTRILGEKGENLEYIRRSTGARVLMKGRGSGVQSNKPLHVFISHSTLKGMEDAEKLAQNLARVVQEDLDEYLAKEKYREPVPVSSSGRGMSPPNKVMRYDDDGYRDGGQGSSWNSSTGSQVPGNNPQHIDRGRSRYPYSDSSYSAEYPSTGRPDRMREGNVRYEGGPGGSPVRERQDSYTYGNRDRYDDRRQAQAQTQAPKRPRTVDESKYCELCNIRCPNDEMFYTHCKGLMHSQNLQLKNSRGVAQRRPAAQMDRGFNNLEGTHWAGPPSPKHARRQPTQVSGGSIEEWVFTGCERILEMQINSTSLRNLRRSVEKIGLRNIESALPTKMQSNQYCKLCKLETDNMQTHLTSNTHGVLYLLRQIQLGDAFIEYYSDVPIPGVITDGGRVLAMDALSFGPCIPETNRERFKELLVYSGAFLSYNCKVCDMKINALNQWIQHTTSKKHGKHVVTLMIKLGFDEYVDKFKNIPVPPPKSARKLAAELVINELHHSVPARKAHPSPVGPMSPSSGGQSGSQSQDGSTFYQKLAALSQQDRQLVLQVQVLTGISDINVILAALNALSNLDPGMLETLCNMDSLAIEHAMAGNKALQDMDAHVVQQVIQFYTKFKFGSKFDRSNVNLAIGKPGMGGGMGSMRGRQSDVDRYRGKDRRARGSYDDRGSARGRLSRWEPRDGDRGGKDRRRTDPKGSDARKDNTGQRHDNQKGRDKKQQGKDSERQKGKGDGKGQNDSKDSGDKKNVPTKDSKQNKDAKTKSDDKDKDATGKDDTKKTEISKPGADKIGDKETKDKEKTGQDADKGGKKEEVIVIPSDTEEMSDVFIVKSEVSGDNDVQEREHTDALTSETSTENIKTATDRTEVKKAEEKKEEVKEKDGPEPKGAEVENEKKIPKPKATEDKKEKESPEPEAKKMDIAEAQEKEVESANFPKKETNPDVDSPKKEPKGSNTEAGTEAKNSEVDKTKPGEGPDQVNSETCGGTSAISVEDLKEEPFVVLEDLSSDQLAAHLEGGTSKGDASVVEGNSTPTRGKAVRGRGGRGMRRGVSNRAKRGKSFRGGAVNVATRGDKKSEVKEEKAVEPSGGSGDAATGSQ